MRDALVGVGVVMVVAVDLFRSCISSGRGEGAG
jgi:hypothetical protein